MQSARSIDNAVLHRTAIVLWALFFAAFSALAQTPTTSKKKTAAKTASKPTAKRTTASSKTVAGARRSNTAGMKQEASSGTHRVRTRKVVVTRKLVHGHWVRTTQIVHAPPAPSYQTHPDPERYQQIQQALANSGYFKGQVNGEWGDDSVAALKQFQTDHKLVNDGKISSLSLISLGLGPNREASAKPVAVVKDTADSTPTAAAAAPAEAVHN